MKQRVSMGNGGQAIIITNLEFDEDGFVTNQKAGILPFDPDLDPAAMLEKAAKNEWELHGLKNIQGFFSVRKKRPLTEEELSKQILSSTGRSIVNQVVDSEVITGPAGDFLTRETNSGSRINNDALIRR